MSGMRVLAAIFLLAPLAGSWAQGVAQFPPQGEESNGDAELHALAAAYPDRVSEVSQQDGDWAALVNGRWFFWAHGRILPGDQRADWEKYARFRFYSYPPGDLPPLPVLDAETTARLRKVLADSRVRPPRRSEAFLEQLYDAAGRAATERRMTSVDFLGFSVTVHERIAAPLAAAAQEIQQAAKKDPQVAAFLKGLNAVDGFNYRDVAGTLSRSYHSYGLAVDFIPRSYGGKAAYWRWVPNGTSDWWTIPHDHRWMMPMAVVAAFERQGFVWGGKWLFFDMMHFEYRPEIFILSSSQGGQR